MDLFTVKPDGTDLKQVTSSPHDDLFPSWAPGGGKIAFVRVNGASQQVFVVKPDGTGSNQLTHSSTLKGALAWSPNAQKIALTAGPEGNADIFVMNADGSGAHRLPGGTSPASDGAPGWQRL